MEYLCFGGSFNPIHNGHLACSIEASKQVACKGVLLIPNFFTPQKKSPAIFADAHDRLEMCRLAAADLNAQGHDFDVDDLEYHLPAPSYTLNTVRALKLNRGWSRVLWMIGADMLMDLPNWHRPLDLLNETQFVVVNRPGHDILWDHLPPAFHSLKNWVVNAPLLDISSTQIRKSIANHESWEPFVPKSVAHFINAKGLYRGRL